MKKTKKKVAISVKKKSRKTLNITASNSVLDRNSVPTEVTEGLKINKLSRQYSLIIKKSEKDIPNSEKLVSLRSFGQSKSARSNTFTTPIELEGIQPKLLITKSGSLLFSKKGNK